MKNLSFLSINPFNQKLKPGIGILLICFLISTFCYSQKPTIEREKGAIKVNTLVKDLEYPWAIAFLPDNRLLLTERTGRLRIVDTANNISEPVQGIPQVFAKGQGGLQDVAIDPDFAKNNYVYFTFTEQGPDSTATTALGRGILKNNRLNDFKVLFKMEPYVEGNLHFGSRIAFSLDGKIMLTLAERFKFDPAQDLSNHLGTIVRLNKDGSVPKDNPFINQADARDEIFSYGHRNIESAAIDPNTGKLWIAEMGPMGGDEFTQPIAGKNYGWPIVSWGRNYDGTNIPNPDTRPEFEGSKIVWTPTISPSGMFFYNGEMYPEWKNHAIIGGLTSSGLVIVKVENDNATEVERVPLAARIRDVAQGPDGSVYVITDAEKGMLLKLVKMD